MKIDLIDMIGLGLIMILCMFFGYGFGVILHEEKLEEQLYINERLRLEYNELRANYDTLEISYRWGLEQAREHIIKLESNRYDVNLDGSVNAADYVAIKNYIMNEE